MTVAAPEPRVSRIFLSSTHADLAYERVIARQSLRLCDVEVVRSESFTRPGDEPSWDVCQRELLACDGYMLLVGDEYGSTVPGLDLSFTQAEYELARKRRLPVWVFVKRGVVPKGPDARRYRDFIASVNDALMWSAEFESGEQLANEIERTFKNWRPVASNARPRFGKLAASPPEQILSEPLKYAIGHVRRTVLRRAPFLTVFVDTRTIDRPELDGQDPRRLLDCARTAREQIVELGAAARFIQDIIASAGTEAELSAKRIAIAAEASSLILCFVTGEADYPEVRRFRRHQGRLATFRPQNVAEVVESWIDTQETYLYPELDGPLTVRVVDYVEAELDDHLVEAY